VGSLVKTFVVVILCHLRRNLPRSGNGSTMLTIMNSKATLAIIAGIVLALALASCGGSGPIPTPTSAPTLTPMATPTPTPRPTATAQPTPTPVDIAVTRQAVAAATAAEPGLTAEEVKDIVRQAIAAAATATSTPAPTARTIPEIIAELTVSVVHIQTEAVRLDEFNRPSPGVGVGTGEIIDDQGHILTNNHVIAGAERILVTLSDGRVFEAELIGGDSTLDLAVLRIEAEGLVPIPIGKSSNLAVGDQVIAIGHALNLPGGPTITGGWVSALDRTIDVSQAVTMQNLIQTDAAINPGNSGGPLINRVDGKFVGINTARLPSAEGIGFAIAIDTALPIIKELIANGRIDRGFLGVSTVNITDALARNFDLPVTSGAGILSVVPDSPADKAGLRERDIIVAMAGKTVSNVAELDSILIGYREGNSVEVEFFRFREDTSRKVTLTLAARPG